MTRTPYMLRYITGLQQVTSNSSAYLQPDGHYGLNNAAVFWTPAGAVLVDTAFDVPRARNIVDAVLTADRKPAGIAALFLTHDHGDHSYGACAVPTDRVIMTTTAAAALKENASGLSVRIGSLKGDALSMIETMLADKFDFSTVRYRPATETFSAESRFDFGGKVLRAIEFTQVHTVSDSILFDEQERVAATGDLMFADSHIPLFRPAAKRWASVMEQFLELDVDTFIPGHGRICNREDVKEHRDYLLWIYDEAEQRFRRGLSHEEAADDLITKLGPYEHMQRADILVNSMDVLYREISPDHVPASYSDGLAQRWRFRMRWRGRVPNLCEPLPLNSRLGGFKTLSALRMLETTS